MSKRTHLKILSELAKESGYSLRRIVDNVFELKKGNKRIFIHSQDFGLNSALATKLSVNKSQTYMVLKENKIPAVPHFGLYNPETYAEFGDQKKRNNARIDTIVRHEKWPLVIKPAEGHSGRGVELVSRKRDIKNVAKNLFIRNDEVVLSPFRVIEHEYRVIILSGKAELVFDKIKKDKNEFRYNLCLGAKSEVLNLEDKKAKKLGALAKRATKALGLEFASVDIIETEEFGLEILEINSLVSLDYFGAETAEKYQIAKNIYKKAFKKSLKN